MRDENRKKTFIKSQNKRRAVMMINDKKTLSVYVNSKTKESLKRIKMKNGYTTLGDAIDYLADKYE